VVVPAAPGRSESDPDLPGPPPVRWGVIGATSRIAQLGVLPALASSPKSRLVAVASRSNPDGGYEAFGAERTYGRYEDVLADPDVEAVYLPLPNSLHSTWTIAAAEAGKHVLCEKPLATTSVEADAMATACDGAGVVLMEAYMTPFHPRSTVLEDTLRTGRLGSLRFARSVFTGVLGEEGSHRWRPDMGGGVLLDVGVYCLAPLLVAAGGRPLDVAASMVAGASGVDTSFSGWLDFGDGFVASFDCSFEVPECQRLELVGTQAAMTVERPFTPGPDDTLIHLRHRDGRDEDLECRARDPYRGMLDHFCTVLRGGAGLRRPPAQSIELLGVLDLLRAAATRR
jgi:xylose dehydrogenase (NAD/NADP)